MCNYLRVVQPSMFALVLENFCIEVAMLLACLQGKQQVALSTIICNIYGILASFSATTSITASILVGTSLASNNITRIKKNILIMFLLDFCVNVVIVIVLSSFSNHIASIYTDKGEIESLFDKSVWCLQLFQSVDSKMWLLIGIAKGLFITKPVLYSSSLANIIINPMLAYILSRKLKILGFWLSLSVCEIFICLVLFY